MAEKNAHEDSISLDNPQHAGAIGCIKVSAFTLLNGIALRPLRAPGADKLVAMYQKMEGQAPRPRSILGSATGGLNREALEGVANVIASSEISLFGGQTTLAAVNCFQIDDAT